MAGTLALGSVGKICCVVRGIPAVCAAIGAGSMESRPTVTSRVAGTAAAERRDIAKHSGITRGGQQNGDTHGVAHGGSDRDTDAGVCWTPDVAEPQGRLPKNLLRHSPLHQQACPYRPASTLKADATTPAPPSVPSSPAAPAPMPPLSPATPPRAAPHAAPPDLPAAHSSGHAPPPPQ